MKHKTLNERIVSDPVVLLDKHVIRGTHVPVYLNCGIRRGRSDTREDRR
ncbi:hypothetical protein BH24CHL2_BH24CHL2_2260 [soil metagenome]